MLLAVCTFAQNKHVAQCKMNSKSYVVASQDVNSTKIEVEGYGDAANSTVVVTYKVNGGGVQEYTVTIKNGYGEVRAGNALGKLIKVSNIVCYDK